MSELLELSLLTCVCMVCSLTTIMLCPDAVFQGLPCNSVILHLRQCQAGSFELIASSCKTL